MSFTTVRPGSAWTSEHCSLRVVRDGSWIDDPRSLRSACKAFEKVYFRKDGSRVPVLVGAATFGGRRDQGVAFWRFAFPQTPYLVVTAEEDLASPRRFSARMVQRNNDTNGSVCGNVTTRSTVADVLQIMYVVALDLNRCCRD
jgi:hypothetical protein